MPLIPTKVLLSNRDEQDIQDTFKIIFWSLPKTFILSILSIPVNLFHRFPFFSPRTSPLTPAFSYRTASSISCSFLILSRNSAAFSKASSSAAASISFLSFFSSPGILSSGTYSSTPSATFGRVL